jgi:hypothetical protein
VHAGFFFTLRRDVFARIDSDVNEDLCLGGLTDEPLVVDRKSHRR